MRAGASRDTPYGHGLCGRRPGCEFQQNGMLHLHVRLLSTLSSSPALPSPRPWLLQSHTFVREAISECEPWGCPLCCSPSSRLGSSGLLGSPCRNELRGKEGGGGAQHL